MCGRSSAGRVVPAAQLERGVKLQGLGGWRHQMLGSCVQVQ